jgi:alkane 1-monooxygenase
MTRGMWKQTGQAATTAEINGRPIVVRPRETLLQAALRHGIDFPHHCRVGGCGTCRCRLAEGEVRSLTDASYLLSAADIAKGTILACQSQPLTDVRIEADLERWTRRRAAAGATAPPAEPLLTAGEAAPTRTSWVALHYLKFFGFHLVGLFAAAALLAGGPWAVAGLLGVLAFYIVGDAICGDDTSTPAYRHPGILTVQLWLALPLIVLIVFAAVWSVSPADPFGIGATLTSWTGHDLLAAREATTAGQHAAAWILTGFMIGMIGTVTAHELIHRTWDPVSMLVGRWLLAFSLDTSFSIEHVYGHHRYVSTTEDPATAPRGRGVYAHIVISTLRGNRSAWRLERRRLARLGLPLISWHNTVIRGQAMSLAVIAAAAWVGGWRGALFFLACAAWGKALLEIVNYMEHYGLVRVPADPVQPRHSWNSNRRISSWTLFNLTRHSHHHAQGEVPYQDLRPMPDAPMMINGYLTTIVLAMIPPLWHRLMTPKLLAWDRDRASPRERELAARANSNSGIRRLEQAVLDDSHCGPKVPA